jgi:pimeloyl-ACP methyl ester carboxylesterase
MAAPLLAYDDTGGSGPLVILLPGAGDVRSENHFLAQALVESGYRVVNADLPGHGESNTAESYGVAEAADALLSLIQELDCGPAVVIATSFSPAAAVWAAAAQPDKIAALVAISPHLEADESLGTRLLGALISVLIRGPWAASAWSKFYRSWYKSQTPDDLDQEIDKMRNMLKDAGRRRAVRETLTAHRRGMPEKIEAITCPALVIFGSADDHFPDPSGEASRIGSLLNGETVMVPGAGHYPHVEHPEIVGPAVVDFLSRITR